MQLRFRRHVWVYALALVAGASLVLVARPTVGAAAPCPDPAYNSIASPDTNGRGVRVTNPGLMVDNDGVQCVRIASIGINNTSGLTYVEVGWYEDPAGGADIPCLPTTGTAPKVIAFAAQDGVPAGCWMTPVTVSGTDSFTVHDDNQNGNWTFLHLGGLVWTSPDLSPFHTGIIVSNGERWDLDDGAHADFDGLQRMGSTMSWTDWQNTFRNTNYDDDPGFFPCIYSADDTHVEVKKNGNSCP